jgi:hypothetical protein
MHGRDASGHLVSLLNGDDDNASATVPVPSLYTHALQTALTPDTPEQVSEPEQRVVLFLSRFSTEMVIIHATDRVTQTLGLSSVELQQRPFYDCIQPNCLDKVQECLKSLKTSESTAYLRFWYKDPRIDPNNAINDGEKLGNGGSLNADEDVIEHPYLLVDGLDMDKGAVSLTRSAQKNNGARAGGVGVLQGCASLRPRMLEAIAYCKPDYLVVVLWRAPVLGGTPQPAVTSARQASQSDLALQPTVSSPVMFSSTVLYSAILSSSPLALAGMVQVVDSTGSSSTKSKGKSSTTKRNGGATSRGSSNKGQLCLQCHVLVGTPSMLK